MGVGTLAWACLWLLGQVPSDVVYSNELNHRIDVQFKVQRAEIKELRLFCSPNEGRDWDLADSIKPEKDYFVFRAPGDGTYWLRVASVNHKGEQYPENPRVGPPNQKMVIDTLKPIIRALHAQRQGGEIHVSWEIKEDHPDVPSFRLEYQPKDGGAGLWTAIKAIAAPNGEARFQATGPQALLVRLTLRDLAGNESFAVIEVAPDGVTNAAFNSLNHSGAPTQIGGTSPPGNTLELSKGVTIPPAVSGGTPPVGPPPVGPPPVGPLSTGPGPLPPPNPVANGGKAPTVPGDVVRNAASPPPITPGTVSHEDVIAGSEWKSAPSPQPPITTLTEPPNPVVKPTTTPPSRKLPALQYINQPEFLVDYEVSKLGPSGIGSVELYRTRDDGQTWERFAYDGAIDTAIKGKPLQRRVQFPKGEPDGIYGFTLVVKNRASIGRHPPEAGEVPELRIELDTTLPSADLLKPARDTQPGHLLLTWRAADKNLTPAPINLEWSETRNGPWQPIGLDLPNTGRYAWKLPEVMPVNVYLRLRVRDLAGNECIVATPNPLPVDLHEPEGHLLKVSLPVRQP